MAGRSGWNAGFFSFCMLVSGAAGAGESRVPDLEPSRLRAAPPASLYWITLTPSPSSSVLGVALEMRAGNSGAGTLEARVLGEESHVGTPPRSHRERWGDRVQSFFPMEHGGCCGEGLEFLLRGWGESPASGSILDPDTVSFRRTAIPFMGCSVRDEAGSFPVVIPELRWEAPHPGSGAWVYWKLSVREPGAARFLVQDDAGACVRTWPAGPLQAGPVILLWDGMDDAGNPACSGPYSLILEGGGIDLETFQERGKPWI